MSVGKDEVKELFENAFGGFENFEELVKKAAEEATTVVKTLELTLMCENCEKTHTGISEEMLDDFLGQECECGKAVIVTQEEYDSFKETYYYDSEFAAWCEK